MNLLLVRDLDNQTTSRLCYKLNKTKSTQINRKLSESFRGLFIILYMQY